MLFAPLLGRRSDRLLKRRIFLVVGSLIAFLVSVSYYFVQTGTQLLIIGFFSGTAYAFFPLINTIFRENFPNRRGSRFGWFSAANSLGWGVGGLTAGIFADIFGLKGAFVVLGLFHLLNALLSHTLLPRKKVTTEEPYPAASISRRIINLYAAFAIRHTGAMALWSVFPLYLKQFTEDITLLGLLFSLNFVVQPLFMILVGRYSEGADKTKLFAAGLTGSIVIFWGFARAQEVWHIALAQILISVVWSFIFVSINTYLMDEVPEEGSAQAFGFLNSSQTLAAVIGPVIGGTLTDILGFRDMIFAASGIMALSLLPSARLIQAEARGPKDLPSSESNNK
jgi:MFS family permease